jgi:hypothetical protein
MFSGLYSEIISIISEYSLLKRLFPEKPHTNQPFQNSIFIHKPRSKSIIEYFFKKERKRRKAQTKIGSMEIWFRTVSMQNFTLLKNSMPRA